MLVTGPTASGHFPAAWQGADLGMNDAFPPFPIEGEWDLGRRAWEVGLPVEAGLLVVGAQSVSRPEDLPARGQDA